MQCEELNALEEDRMEGNAASLEMVKARQAALRDALSRSHPV